MAELVAHEVQVAVPCGCGGNEAYHLVKGYSPVHQIVLRGLVHCEIHLLVHEAEDNGLVAHEGLVMAFGIGDGLLFGALAGEFPPDFAHGPLLVALFLYPLDPVVCNAHGHAEVKAHAAGLEGGGKAGHCGDILCYGEAVRVHFLDQHGGKGEVCDGVFIDTLVEVEGIVAEVLAKAVVPIEHGGYAVEAETVYVILFHPVLDVGEEEVLGFVFAVVEAAGAPCGVLALGAAVEVCVVCAVKF